MRELLRRYVAVVEIIFAMAILVALIYAVYAKDAVTTGTIIGGIFGYMKGRTDGSAAESLPAVGQTGRAGLNVIVFMAFMAMLVFSIMMAGCASTNIQQSISCGEFQRDKSDTKQATTDSTKLDGNQASVNPNVSLVPK